VRKHPIDVFTVIFGCLNAVSYSYMFVCRVSMAITFFDIRTVLAAFRQLMTVYENSIVI